MNVNTTEVVDQRRAGHARVACSMVVAVRENTELQSIGVRRSIQVYASYRNGLPGPKMPKPLLLIPFSR